MTYRPLELFSNQFHRLEKIKLKNVILANGYYLTVEGKAYVLGWENPTKSGSADTKKRKRTKTIGYYSTLGNALLAYRRTIIRDTVAEQDAINLKEALALVKRLDGEIKRQLTDAGLAYDAVRSA